MKKNSLLIILLFTTLVITSGCLYPKGELAQNQIPSESQIAMVQTAVDKYQEQTKGLVPIETMPSDTPIFEKYVIDFNHLKNEGLLPELPGNSFEKGGYFKYALVDPETNPTVKLIDVRISQKLQEVYRKIHTYREKASYLPLADNIVGNYFELDFHKLGYREEQFVSSPYSKQDLPIIIDSKGTLYVDYRLDIHKLMQENDFNLYEDIRYILVDNSPILPAYSPNYIVEESYPILAD